MNKHVLDYRVTNPKSGGPSFSLKNRIIRALWIVVWAVFASWTPPFMASWRRSLLKLFGARMGPGTCVYGSARVWYPPLLEMKSGAALGSKVNCYNQDWVVLDEGALVSQGAHLCAGSHNINDESFQLITKPIYIGKNAWIAAEAFVGPGVTIQDDAVLGARAVAFSDIGRGMVFIGNPAKFLRYRKNAGKQP
ncbi:putative colanic acid biosynthesis acetyltransferase [Candidatus Methylospira mobilis]|uniref:Putative colanic acid biosynthesis acetyltransferase n=1 Tax=Candidatus Methylospira mobilis TaxID=1808979 RepID=A0A5Q0BDX5_9GAMM|nr:putative colanic acid biosynthesis acetyltransferase [Candidatus Methylospira mobilis]QFY42055.1 putative colanic acid biosynthesis acetyltransferase [Candidatus Methylospira mobilis]